MAQTKAWSALESVATVGSGFVIGVCLTLYVLPKFGFPITVAQSIELVTIYTIASLLRVYYVRRIFEWIHYTFHS